MHTEQTLTLNRVYANPRPARLTVLSQSLIQNLVLAHQVSSPLPAYANTFQHYSLRHWHHCSVRLWSSFSKDKDHKTNKQKAGKAPCPRARSLYTTTFHLAGGLSRVTGGRSSGGAEGGWLSGISSYLHLKDVNCMIIIVLCLNKKKHICEMYSKILRANTSTGSASSSRDWRCKHRTTVNWPPTGNECRDCY
jgi:hypothetical protein